MDLEVVGRHALLFDDDSSASFVNSAAALVDWNSLSIDRYDVRHLLSAPPPRVKRLHNHLSPSRRPESPSQSEVDHERYLDLPSTSPPEEHDQDLDDGAGPVNDGSYRAVPFSYRNADEPSWEKDADAESGFRPPFSLPKNLLQNLPPTEKVHQIIARTAMFVSKHGGQSEIVLRVKQGDNPTFGFLMPDHHLHPYFRFLVDHPELLSEENKPDSELDQTSGAGRGGALSLLGSVYGSGEDEDGADEDAPELKRNGLEDTVDAVSATVSNGSERTNSPIIVAGKDETVSKHSLPPLKEKLPLIKRNQSISTVKTRTSTGTKKDGGDKSQASALPSMSKVEPPIVEPPSDIKRVVDKIVEFILRNGKEFEAVLVEQDRNHGRFPFLLPSNLYYPYYLKVLRKAEESKLPGKGFSSEKLDSAGPGVDKKHATSKESDILSLGSDIPYDSDRKEKFKMVLGKSKKDGQDPPAKATRTNTGVTVDAAAAAAILQVATRGIRNPNLESLMKMCFNGGSQGSSVESGQANTIGKSAAMAASSEADSSEAYLSREEKLKAERLKRAKLFATMIKNKAAPSKTEPLRSLSVEPPESGFSSGSGADVVNLVGNERGGSVPPHVVHTSDVIEESEKKDFGDDHERRSKRSYRSRCKRNEEEEEEEEREGKDHKHSKKKRKSHRSSHGSRDQKRHSSSKDSDSLRHNRHNHDNSSDHEDRHSSKHRHKHDSTSVDDHRRSRDPHSSSDDEHWRSRHRRHKHDSSSSNVEHSRSGRRHRHDISSDEEEHKHRRRSSKHRKRSHPEEKEVDLEEGEIKSDQSKASERYGVGSREASVDLSKSYQDAGASSQPSNTNEVSDELRAKIRAMLMATL